MRIIIFPAFLAATCWLLLTGCYKDKGNYQYHDINTINSGIPDTTLTVFQFDTLHLHTNIQQSMPAQAGLSYEWVMYPAVLAPLTRRTLGTTADLDALITEAPGSYGLNLFITDNATQITTIKKMQVKVVSALNEGWLVLEDGNTMADVSIINPVDSIFHHIYSKANPQLPLPVGTHHVYVTNRRGEQNIYLLSPAGGTQVYFSTFMAIADFRDWFFVAPTPKPQIFTTFDGGEAIINNGQPYILSLFSPAPFKFGIAPPGNYYMAPFQMPSIYGPLLYDTVSQRFMTQDIYSSALLAFDNSPAEAAFNMNKVNKHMQFAENGSDNKAYCLFRNNNNDSLFIYTVNNDGSYSNPGTVSAVENAPGLSTANLLIMSKLLPHLYYTSGNKLYLYDIPAAKARVVYTFAAGTDIRRLKLAPGYRTMVIATHESGEGKVYYFPIAATGDFEGNTYSKVFNGFGKINDLSYKPAP